MFLRRPRILILEWTGKGLAATIDVFFGAMMPVLVVYKQQCRYEDNCRFKAWYEVIQPRLVGFSTRYGQGQGVAFQCALRLWAAGG